VVLRYATGTTGFNTSSIVARRVGEGGTMRIFDPRKQKYVRIGHYDNDTRVFTKRVQPQHLLKLYDAYGLQDDAIEQLNVSGCLTIRIVEEDGRVLESPFMRWYRLPVRDYGHGPQKFLCRKDMVVVSDKHNNPDPQSS
jgi:hypothetical protein